MIGGTKVQFFVCMIAACVGLIGRANLVDVPCVNELSTFTVSTSHYFNQHAGTSNRSFSKGIAPSNNYKTP